METITTIGQQVMQSQTGSHDASLSVKARWSTIERFEREFNHSLQLFAISDTDAYIMSDSPRLCDMAREYGEEDTKTWMGEQLIAVFGLTRTSEDTDMLLTELTNVLFERFRFERAKVFILFCGKCRAREYKISYGTVKIDSMLDAANDFLKSLPGMKERLGDRQQRARTEMVAHNGWRFVTYRGLWDAWRDSVFRRYDEAGAEGLRASLMDDDEYSAAIQALMGIKALTIDSRVTYIDEAYEDYVGRLRDTHEYFQKRKSYRL